MTTSAPGTTGECYVANQGPLPDSEVDRLAAAALKGMLSNHFTPEVQVLAEDFVAYGSEGVDSLLEHFNEKLARFWSPYRLRAERDSNSLTIKLMRMENGRLQPSGPTVQVAAS